MSSQMVVLRDTKDADGSRHLTASRLPGGELQIEGLDSGPGVARILGFNEYEWIWKIEAADVAKLQAALDSGPDVIEALGRRFSGDDAAGLGAFLEANGVPYQVWSRVGD